MQFLEGEMSERIGDERLKAFAEYEKDTLDDFELVDVANEVLPEMAQEIISFRKENNNLKRVEGIWILREKELCEQKKVLIEDANNLANELFGWLGNAQFRKPMSGDSAMKNHAALIKKLEK